MPKEEGYEEMTDAGAVDDDALKRAKAAKKKKKNILQDIFDDNKTGRYGPGTDS